MRKNNFSSTSNQLIYVEQFDNNLSINRILKSTIKSVPIGVNPLNQLQLKWDGAEDFKQLKYLLNQVLQYPSTDLADLHRDSNRLGNMDILENQKLYTRRLYLQNQPEIFCKCCGFLLQNQQIPICTSFKNIRNLGLSTYLYFRTLINLIILLSLLFLIYGIFCLGTNIIAFNQDQQKDEVVGINFLLLSLSSKHLHRTQRNQTFQLVQFWLALTIVIVWCIVFVLLKYYEKHDQILLQNKNKSASVFSVVFEGVPTNFTMKDMQKQLNDYYNRLSSQQKPSNIDRPFKIVKYNIAMPFNLTIDQLLQQNLKTIIQQKNIQRKMFIQWIKQRKNSYQFPMYKRQRLLAYNQYRKLQNLIQSQYKRITKKIINQKKQKFDEQSLTSVFVTFQSSYAKQLLLHLNCPHDKITKLQKRFGCCQKNTYFLINFQDKKFLTIIKKAPQPQDILWTNIGKSNLQMFLRKLLTFTVAFIVLVISFVSLFFLSKQKGQQNVSNLYITFIISIVISVINVALQWIIQILTRFERQTTKTKFQTSLAVKIVFAQMLNSILLPLLINYYIQQNIYRTSGLAYDIFSLGITNACLPPILKIFDSDYIFWRIKCWYYKRPLKKLEITQTELNNINEFIPFKLGLQYVYPVNIFLFTCFFVTLQPMICLFGVLGLISIYWIQKYAFLNRFRRPFPGNDLTNIFMYQMIYFGPLFFSIGNLVWQNLLNQKGSYMTLIPNLIAAALSLIFALVPYTIFFNRILDGVRGEELLYSENRIYLSSQYDRLNPVTSKQALIQHYKFVKQYQQQIKEKSQQKLKAIQNMLGMERQKGVYQVPQILKIFGKFSTSQNLNIIQEEPTTPQIKKFGIDQLIKFKQKQKNKVSISQQIKQFKIFQNKDNKIQFISNWEQQKLNQNNFNQLKKPNKQTDKFIIYDKQSFDTSRISREDQKLFYIKVFNQNKQEIQQIKLQNNEKIIQTTQQNKSDDNLGYDQLKRKISDFQETPGMQKTQKQQKWFQESKKFKTQSISFDKMLSKNKSNIEQKNQNNQNNLLSFLFGHKKSNDLNQSSISMKTNSRRQDEINVKYLFNAYDSEENQNQKQIK